MELFHVSTHDQAADCLTKSLPSEALGRHHMVIAGADDIIKKPQGSEPNATFQAKTPGILLSGAIDAARIPGDHVTNIKSRVVGRSNHDDSKVFNAMVGVHDLYSEGLAKLKARFVSRGMASDDLYNRACADPRSQD
eukprot:2790930-Rhodomonas_salina.1